MATTVIVGSGVIGLSTAYYLARQQPGTSVRLVDSSPRLFASASGYAGGFVARDWFRSSVSELGALSFGAHRALAEAAGGRVKWGYSRSVTLSSGPGGRDDGARGEDWLLEGTSRLGVAAHTGPEGGEAPAWLRGADGHVVSVVDGGEGTAIVDPLKLCHFLLAECEAAGVRVHHPATVVSVGTDADNVLDRVRIRRADPADETDVAATRLVLCAGAWTPQVLASLFPGAAASSVPVTSLGGHSLVVRAPGGGQAGDACHSIFMTLDSLSPEMFSRADGVIYIAGVNSATIPLPPLATGAAPVEECIEELKTIARRHIESDGELEVVRSGLCFRPVTARGTPFLARLPDELLGADMRTRPGAEGGVFVAAGHGPWGISLSLGTGIVMAEMMSGKKTSADISGLGL